MTIDRRAFLQVGIGGLLASGLQAQEAKPTEFRVACMTLAYAAFPFQRALEGLKNAGYRYIALGINHKEEGAEKASPILPADATPAQACDLAKRCRDLGLEPQMMFATVYPEVPNGLEVHRQR